MTKDRILRDNAQELERCQTTLKAKEAKMRKCAGLLIIGIDVLFLHGAVRESLVQIKCH